MTPGQALRRRRAIEQIAHLFNDQPYRQIRKALASKSDLPVTLHEPDSSATKTDKITETVGSTFQSDFQDELRLLRKYHIFSWDVHYYPCFEKYFARFLSETARLLSSDSGRVLSEPLTKHARDIFSAGYQYKPEESPANRLDASLNGLRRFLDLPRKYYTVQQHRRSDRQSALALRELRSAATAGILVGFSCARFGDEKGNVILLRRADRWLESFALLTPSHADWLLTLLGASPLSRCLVSSALPTLDALQELLDSTEEDGVPVWVTGGYEPNRKRLEINLSIGLSPPLRLSAVLETVSSAEDLADIDEKRLVVVPVRAAFSGQERTRTILVGPNGERAQTANRVFKELSALYSSTRNAPQHAPQDVLSMENVARGFPLDDQGRMKAFFHVSRRSVSEMLQEFRNGVRLWCSVRRSGKTTACYDMGPRIHDSTLAYQTCLLDGNSRSSNTFFDLTRAAVVDGRSISDRFVDDVIGKCTERAKDRVILIVDEYERFFGILDQHAARSDNRRMVVEQILDQLCVFAENNLLVFMGQRPGAHSILMSSSHLAYRVRQEPFPLFAHGSEMGEFREFVEDKVLSVKTTRVGCTTEFLDVLFKETAGHPFLTVNVLVDLVDWLVGRGQFFPGATIKATEFDEFVRSRLNVEEILLPMRDGEGYYDGFFVDAAANALSKRMGGADPWLYAVYWTLRLIARRDPLTFRVGLKEFEGLLNELPLPMDTELPSSRSILTTATKANFLTFDANEKTVGVKIRTLGRIAAAVEPQVA